MKRFQLSNQPAAALLIFKDLLHTLTKCWHISKRSLQRNQGLAQLHHLHELWHLLNQRIRLEIFKRLKFQIDAQIRVTVLVIQNVMNGNIFSDFGLTHNCR
ncbi:hypothetical protein ADL19_31635 [Streptomyces purpurogeneiscleroticus]|nr:hypothetical protein ADL19_31635 [Streptomyces purpurogeneiscleroticus]